MKAVAAAAAFAAASAHGGHHHTGPRRIKDVRAKGWKTLGRAQETDVKTFSVAMPMADYEGLEKKVLEISDPAHATYGQWLSKEQVEVFTTTPAPVAKEVQAWAESTGAACTRLANSFKCAGAAPAVEALFDTELSIYGHTATGRKIMRASTDAAMPAELEGKVLMVTGLRNFPVPRLGSVRPIEAIVALGAVDYSVVPSTLVSFYNITSFDGSAASTQAPVEFQGYPAYVQTDLDTFATSTKTPDYTIPASHIIGPFAPDPAAESTLDQQYIGSIGQGNTNWYWTEADWMYEFSQDLNSQPAAQLPSVLSMSYAWYELDNCQISPNVAPCSGQPVPAGSAIFVAAVNKNFAAAVARGVTMLAASGDSGSHGRTDPSCADPNTRPDFPSSSPWVTSVGATEIDNGQTGPTDEPICSGTLTCATGGYEIVASNKALAFFSSGGGFSKVSPRPAWQDAVVSAYLKNASAVPPFANFNSTNRGAPDLAALGHNYYIELGGQVTAVDGTSAATPVVAGMLASLNAWRLKAGKPVLGFANPLLYAIYAADKTTFNDVVQGDNTCTEDACPCPAGTGYYAAPGWDATTGLGTPNYGKIKAAILQMGI